MSMSSPINDTSMLPTGAQGAQPGIQNTSTSSTGRKEDRFATGGTMSGHTGIPSESGYTHGYEHDHEHHHNPFKHPHDSCEAEPGLIESTDLAPLNHEVVAPDHPMNKGQQQGQTSRTSKKM
ncbi:hypothetical protein I302_105882 [Kwoniella bestiolae CBS 10118]|uniref:Uncharacterized protein n=1 Tax=Kwoniella bestiolae CBS 10118 TaxID=1296100 RepID=A0A1B9G2E8_9TREE|nr:hypothetical protein I302_05007 [Kwoniella bestiolae CBS 10118]OCF25194.1 hypothetical protein I302_05007 [Kwoniella bestiolae CBS 10118]